MLQKCNNTIDYHLLEKVCPRYGRDPISRKHNNTIDYHSLEKEERVS